MCPRGAILAGPGYVDRQLACVRRGIGLQGDGDSDLLGSLHTRDTFTSMSWYQPIFDCGAVMEVDPDFRLARAS